MSYRGAILELEVQINDLRRHLHKARTIKYYDVVMIMTQDMENEFLNKLHLNPNYHRFVDLETEIDIRKRMLRNDEEVSRVLHLDKQHTELFYKVREWTINYNRNLAKLEPDE
jgi:hypothetical protein